MAISSQSALSGVFDLAVVGAGIIGMACARAAALKGLRVQAVLSSSIDLRVESREAIPKIAAWLAARLADPGFRLPGIVMSELGLMRYPGYSALAAAAPDYSADERIDQLILEEYSAATGRAPRPDLRSARRS